MTNSSAVPPGCTLPNQEEEACIPKNGLFSPLIVICASVHMQEDLTLAISSGPVPEFLMENVFSTFPPFRSIVPQPYAISVASAFADCEATISGGRGARLTSATPPTSMRTEAAMMEMMMVLFFMVVNE